MSDPQQEVDERPTRTSADNAAVTEQRMRSRGVWMVTSGAGFVLLILLTAIVWHVGVGHFMPAVYAIPLYAVGFGLMFLGSMEIMFRPHRGVIRDVMAEMERVEQGLQQLAQLLPDEMQQRWYAGYSSGHVDGRQHLTGTDDGPSAGVVRLRQRNERA